MPEVFVTVDDGPEIRLFDEVSFFAEEFIGLTIAEARALKVNKDRAYLQS